MLTAYSFKDVVAALSGPGGNIPLAATEAGTADEGISIEPTGDKGGMITGADGSWMHSLYAASSGTVTVRLLKISIINSQLQAMLDYQATSSRFWGQNVITLRDIARNDHITCKGVAFATEPPLTWAKDGGLIEWKFYAGRIDRRLGTGDASN